MSTLTPWRRPVRSRQSSFAASAAAAMVACAAASTANEEGSTGAVSGSSIAPAVASGWPAARSSPARTFFGFGALIQPRQWRTRASDRRGRMARAWWPRKCTRKCYPHATPLQTAFMRARARFLAGWLILWEVERSKQREGPPMEIAPLGPGFAAELRGVTLAEIAADDAAYEEARAALEQHSVIVFRGQEVTDEAQLAFSRRFGPLEVTKVGSLGAGTNLVILSTIDENGNVVPADHRLALRNKANQLWHTDSTFKRVPALASVLSARVIPARGGETEYVSTRLAWERLEQALRSRLENAFAWHDYAHSRGKIASDLASAEERAALPPQCWRMAWKNPVNGRSALYLASHAYAIEGMEQAAAQKLLGELMDAATAPGLSYVHSWRKGDVVMWDNRATMHRGRPWPAHEARLMVRTTISATEADGLESVRPPSRQAAE